MPRKPSARKSANTWVTPLRAWRARSANNSSDGLLDHPRAAGFGRGAIEYPRNAINRFVHFANARAERNEVKRAVGDGDLPTEKIGAARDRFEQFGLLSSHGGNRDLREIAHFAGHAHAGNVAPLPVYEQNRFDLAAVSERFDEVLQGFPAVLASFDTTIHVE